MKPFAACFIMAAILLLPIEVDSAATANLTVQIRAPGTPQSIAPTSASIQAPNNTGTVVTAITVTMSSGPPFSGTLTIPNTGGGRFGLSGNNMVAARNLVAGDVSGTPYTTQVCATQGTTICQNINVTINASGGAVPAG